MTNVTEFLDEKNIRYRKLPHSKPALTCEEAAKERDVPIDEMIKCILLVDGSYEYYLVCCPADKRLDTKKVQALMHCSRLSFASKEEVGSVLGYPMGAIPPLLLKTDVPIIFDSAIQQKEKVNISSGDPILGIELSAQDLISLISPTFGEVTE